jgi:CheY-like chemotaxis protein
MKAELEMAFVGSASDATVALEKSSHDVLATDMIMTGMDGL